MTLAVYRKNFMECSQSRLEGHLIKDKLYFSQKMLAN